MNSICAMFCADRNLYTSRCCIIALQRTQPLQQRCQIMAFPAIIPLVTKGLQFTRNVYSLTNVENYNALLVLNLFLLDCTSTIYVHNCIFNVEYTEAHSWEYLLQQGIRWTHFEIRFVLLQLISAEDFKDIALKSHSRALVSIRWSVLF